jgi:hypothetical protein
LLIIQLSISNLAFGDGLSQEQISASMGDRKADLLIKTTPPVVTTETLLTSKQKPIIEFRLFDSNTNKSFNHVNYYITIDKEGKKLISDWFHSHEGDLGIKIIPTNTTKTRLSGPQEPLVGGYLGAVNNPTIAEGPIFMNGGIYHFAVRIGTIDCDTCVLPAEQQHLYNSWLSIGTVMNEQLDISGQRVPIKIISYYDKLNNFTFGKKNMQMQFTMPFNWDIKRINSTNIFVHEEIYVPKANAFTSKRSYTGSVNGVDVSKEILLDNSNPSWDVIHVMLPKNTILEIADQVSKNAEKQQQQMQNGTNQLMKFVLQPSMMDATQGTGGGNMSMPMGSMSYSGSMVPSSPQ